jgi:hypothetical protein
MQFYLSAVITVILFSVLVVATTVTISFALARRRAAAVAKRDASTDLLKKVA